MLIYTRCEWLKDELDSLIEMANTKDISPINLSQQAWSTIQYAYIAMIYMKNEIGTYI